MLVGLDVFHGVIKALRAMLGCGYLDRRFFLKELGKELCTFGLGVVLRL